MIRPSDTPTLTRRFTALALAVLFLLQSAAQAGSGCLSSVLAGGCCCKPVVSAVSAPTEVRSCCAERTERARTDTSGPRVTRPSECGCQLAPAPTAPADKVSTDSCERARGTRDADASAGFAEWIALACPIATRTEPCFDPPLLLSAGPPLRLSPTFAATRLAHRGVIGLLSELCTVRC